MRAAYALALVAVIATLVACSNAPEKATPPTSARAQSQSSKHGISGSRGRSPYAAAQEDPNKRGDYTSGGLYAPHTPDSAPADGIHDIELIPEPEVRDEPRSRYGNRSPYTVVGKTYRVLDSAKDYDETGIASYYGNKFHGRRTSSLEVYDMYAFTAAHKTLPLPSFARVTNLDNGRSVVVRVNDRGPFHNGRIIDLSYAAAVKLGVDRAGTARVEVRGLSAGENAREPYEAVADNGNTAIPVGSPAAMPRSGLLPPGVRLATGKSAIGQDKPSSTSAAEIERPQSLPPSAMDRLMGALPVAAANAGGRASKSAAPSRNIPTAAAGGDTSWRFDMRQDGRTMRADEFDAWMRARRARVATGKPIANVAGAGVARPVPGSSPIKADGSGAPVRTLAPDSGRASPAPAGQATPAAIAAAPAPRVNDVTLQVASFAAQENAERALALVANAGIAGARLQGADADGRHVWRLRIGPVAESARAELVARIQGLGFGQPQRVRE